MQLINPFIISYIFTSRIRLNQPRVVRIQLNETQIYHLFSYNYFIDKVTFVT